ncbi:hypothetical protein TWF788_000378 [Orbilia oligospora]|uniref:Altered inheritance of mitochondria protein 11 n=2 Tax=Orbilia oligospora TaxID=2813651 RepID=A0A7C8U2H1_ORBOL|nr:hypothetical protein TWF788_000378 [Orbilia oligospora]KAF3199494.1 hypothetical protein TWF679_001336 [Orbilia oligospora]KAF3203251.1 hypothetical protein TWF191_002673 [Orbilia oligospora]
MGLWPSSWSFWSSNPASPPIQPQSQSPLTEALQITKSEPESQSQSLPTDHRDPTFTPFQRARKQLTLYFGGAGFLLLSMAVARRSTRRRYLATVPKYYTPNTRASELNFNTGIDAFEALNIASLGVFSVGMMTVGAGMYIADVVNVDEMRRLLRSKYGTEGRMSEMDVEEEMEEWIASVLARKDRKEAERTAAAAAAGR